MSTLNYVCGHCNKHVNGEILNSQGTSLTIKNQGYAVTIFWLRCSNDACFAKGSIILKMGKEVIAQYPGAKFGKAVEGLPTEIEETYGEARNCYSVNAFNACELVCRKILMHTAVDKGAKEGATFASYIDYLQAEGYITPPMKPWVKKIKDNGNESTHQIPSPDKKRAEETLNFTYLLLVLIYETAHKTNLSL